MAQKDNSDIGQMPFERAIEELESIVKRLEEGKVPLEESVADLRAWRGAQAPLRGFAAPGGGAGRENHPRCVRQADGERTVRCGLRLAPGLALGLALDL